jgi:hypothetical protein
MRPRHIAQRIRLVDPHIHLVLDNEIHQLRRVPLKLLPCHQKVKQRRPHQPHILRAQSRNRQRRHSARRVSERNQTPLARDAVEREVKRGFPDAVKDGHHAAPVRQLVDALLHVGVRVVDHVRRAGFRRQRDLLIRARRSNHIRPDSFQQLAQPEARTTSSSMHKNPVTLFDVVGFSDQRQRREALSRAPAAILGGREAGSLAALAAGAAVYSA